MSSDLLHALKHRTPHLLCATALRQSLGRPEGNNGECLDGAGQSERLFCLTRVSVSDRTSSGSLVSAMHPLPPLSTPPRMANHDAHHEGALSVEPDQVRDRPDIPERLADVCEDQGRKGEATEIRIEAKRGGVATRITKPTIGRNETCSGPGYAPFPQRPKSIPRRDDPDCASPYAG
jgi:hypothetical protein